MKCTNKEQETAECEKRGCDGCFYNEKTADEMFEELGYKKTRDGIDCWCNYENKIHKISFEKNVKSIFFEDKKDNIVLINNGVLQAINKKVQELRLERINIMENEIKVGEWVRTFNGEIGKIIKIKDDDEYSYDYYICDDDRATGLKSYIAKHSSNIIDLIEVRRLCKWKNCNRNKRMEII